MGIPTNYKDFAQNENHFNFQSNKYDSDRNLYDKLLAESYNHNGVPVDFYITSYDTKYDAIFGEDNNKRVVRKFPLMIFYELPNEEELWNQWGIEGMDNFHMFCSKKHFEVASTIGFSGSGDEIVYDSFDSYKPIVGDILIPKYNKYMYEIVDVREEESMFLQNKHSWDFIVRAYKDEQLSVSDSLSGDFIKDYISQDDILNISGDIDNEKSDVLYNTSGDSEDVNDPLGGW